MNILENIVLRLYGKKQDLSWTENASIIIHPDSIKFLAEVGHYLPAKVQSNDDIKFDGVLTIQGRSWPVYADKLQEIGTMMVVNKPNQPSVKSIGVYK